MGMDSAGPQVNDTATAGVIARPPLLFLAALLLGFASDRLLPFPFTVPGRDPVHWTVAGSLILIGLALAAAGIRNFFRAATPVPTNEPTRALVTTGVHGWSRNPIYLSFSLLQLGVACWVNSLWLLVTLMPAVALMSFVVIPREEHYLESRFPSDYLPYKASVRRWL